ncbi:MAG TPA: sigma-54 dependent transcriptional regulator [Candidatus Dormibacteraeota bacterium]|nr:sigma-54 dependent transcriptional regulator [Candidatus Dormibacteraeota bacterium]
MNASILVVDDEAVFRVLAEEALTAEGFEVRTAESLKKARAEFERAAPDVLILDRRMPDGDGIDFLKRLRDDSSGRGDPSSAPVVIVVTAYGDVENAVEALKAGASDYLTKPVQLTDLVVKLRKVLETRGLKDRLAIARSSAEGPAMVEPKSPAMREVVERLRSVAVSPLTPVFMYGPSGVGKQRAAELLHALTWSGSDPNAPFLEVNCAALPDDLVESELFGHEKGAFTDARTMRRGLFELAAGGTLFLDEITELPQRSQAKLLKVLDTMRFRRLGGEREIAVELRVVAATNQDVKQAVAAGRFREDLYHRLAVFWLTIPPLSARREDIPDLALTFVRFFTGRVKKRLTGLTEEGLAALVAYDYPGNVRELRNIIERAVILARGPEVTPRDLILPETGASAPPVAADGAFFRLGPGPDDSPPTLETVERAYVARVLQFCQGRRMAAAEALGISYPTFLKRLRELGLE